MKNEVVGLLRQLDFTEYEAKAYLALLEKAPLSGYAVALHSGVPRSKVYEVLGTLSGRGDIIASRDDTPQYSPLPPQELLAQRKRHADKVFAAAGNALEHYAAASRTRDGIWNISGHEAIMAKAGETIRGAKIRLLLEAWAEDAEELRQPLEEASQSGVSIQIVAYGEIHVPGAEIFPHDASAEITDDYGGRWLIASADNREIVAGIVSLGADSRAAWTSHPGLVMPITEVIIHDLYLMEILKKFRPAMEDAFGRNLEKLREKYMLPGQGKHYFT